MNDQLTRITADIAAAYVSNNTVLATELPALINGIFGALSHVANPAAEIPEESLKPAISIRKSVTPDHLVCLDCGQKLKTLKRHLTADHGLTPEQYRARWGLPADYPMVAPSYATARSEMAKAAGLGRRGGDVAEPEPEVVQEAPPAEVLVKPRRGRKKTAQEAV